MTTEIRHLLYAIVFISTPAAFAKSADEAALETLVESIGVFADRSEFDALERLFADEVLLDYSSLDGQPAVRRKAADIMTEWAGVLPGFDRTRHAISNIETRITAQKATATADVVAGHWIDGDHWQVDGRYEYAFQRDDGSWEVTAMTFILEEETGSRDVFGPAIEAASANPAPYVQRQRTRQAVLDFLTGLEEKDMAKVNDVWADEAVQEMPYVPEGFPTRVEGRSALIELYAGWPDNAENPSFTDHLLFHPMQDPASVFVEYRGRVDIVPTGREYRQTYGGLFRVDDAGKITLFREYYDPRPFAYAFGLGEEREGAE